jgi:hypothetical protein
MHSFHSVMQFTFCERQSIHLPFYTGLWLVQLLQKHQWIDTGFLCVQLHRAQKLNRHHVTSGYKKIIRKSPPYHQTFHSCQAQWHVPTVLYSPEAEAEGSHLNKKRKERKKRKTCHFFFFLQYWDLNAGPIPWATPPALFWDGFFFEIRAHELFA